MKTTNLMQKLGYRIRLLRNSRGLSQEKLAELAGVHPTYISEVELGKANASISVFDGIALGLGVSLSELVEVQDGDEDIALITLVSRIRGFDEHQRRVFVETATALLNGMQNFKL
ncbi:helix-turn-helix transcriptional regulator [Candidatus Nomurabacteria bacterium]|nr:helix-turn-helix transcriptional regulator [Candidatus Nomurabacteria bacterium]